VAKVPARIPDEVKAEARRLYEAGLPGYTVAKRLGIHYETLRKWTRAEDWVKTLVDPNPVGTGNIEGAIAALGGSLTEAAYDERLRQIALAVPFILGRLDASDLVARADKVAKLVELSRVILGRIDNGRGQPVISVGILSAGGLPRRAAQVELLSNEQVADSQE